MTRTRSLGFLSLLVAFALPGQQQSAAPSPGNGAPAPYSPNDATATRVEEAHQLMEAGRYREAEEELGALLVQTRNDPSPSRATAAVLHTLGLVLHRQGRYREASPLLVEALETAKRIPGLRCAEEMNLLSSLGANHYERGSYEVAESTYRRALTIAGNGCEDGGPATAEALNNLATLAFTRGRYDAAETMYRTALPGYVAAYGQAHPRTAVVQENLGRIHQTRGRFAEAESLYRQALETRESVLGLQHPDVARSLIDLADLHALSGDPAKAEMEARRALLVAERCQQAEPAVAAALVSLANALRLQHRNVEAEWTYRKALPIFEKQYGPNHPQVAAVRLNLAGAYFDQKRYAEAEDLIRRAVEIRVAAFGPDHPKVLAAREAHAKVLKKMDRAKHPAEVGEAFADRNAQ